MRRYVIDAGVLALFFAGDGRVKRFFDEVEAGRAKGYVCDVNLAEFYYKACEKLGRPAAELRYYQLRSSKLSIVSTDEELTKLAGDEKCRHRRALSLADCFALALAKREGAVLLTTDAELARLAEVEVKHFPVS